MTRHSAIALASLLVLVSAVSADAKGRTLKVSLVEISTESQSQPLELTGHDVAAFSVWAGQGVRINGEPQTDGFIADWPKGTPDKRPAGLRRFRVSFYTGCTRDELACSTPETRLSYVVMYEYDSLANVGYVYLAAKGEDGYEINVGSIVRGVEGKWFLATDEWRDYIAPIIARAESGR